MKLVVLCLFAVCCSSLANTSTNNNEKKKLEEVLRQLKAVRESLQQNYLNMTLNTPPRNIEDHCCRSALECFRANLQVKFNVTEKKTNKLYKSLRLPLTLKGLCHPSHGHGVSNCQDCYSHPKENTTEFFNRLESLIQMAIFRLKMN